MSALSEPRTVSVGAVGRMFTLEVVPSCPVILVPAPRGRGQGGVIPPPASGYWEERIGERGEGSQGRGDS